MNRCKWIKPSDEMPDPGVRVIVKANATWGKPWTTIAEYIPKHWVLAEEYMTEDYHPDYMEVGPDGKEYAPEGWWEYPLEPEVDE